MSKHTPEPWCKLNDCGTVKIWGPQGDCVAVNIGCSCDNEANADRIVSCINNCAGINPEAVPEVVAALRGLLRYEGIVVEYMGGMGNLDAERNTQQQFTAARAALAKLEDVE